MRAFTAAFRYASLRRQNSSKSCGSWLNTFSTFCPVTISSTKPFTLPRCICWRTKYFRLLALLNLINANITARKKNTMRDSLQLKMRSMEKVPMMVIKLSISMVKLPFKASVMVSTSLVKRLMSSPWVWVSK